MSGPLFRPSSTIDLTSLSAGASQPASALYRNVLLRTLSAADRKLLAPSLERVALLRRQAVEIPGAAIPHIFFPESGVISVLARAPRERRIEVGLIGFDGMTGFTSLLGDDIAINESTVQVPGEAWRIPVPRLVEEARTSPTLASVLLRYVHAFMAQSSQTALANGSAKLEERIARWLLMSHDRLDSDDLPLTHDFLAQMLGVRRAGVTIALQILESRHFIRARRSLITILDRGGLKRLANGSYGTAEDVYGRLFRSDWRAAAD